MMSPSKEPADPSKISQIVADFHRDGFYILRKQFRPSLLESWNEAFQPLLKQQIAIEGEQTSRGAKRYYVTLPFQGRFADRTIFEDDLILGVCEQLVGANMVLTQLATDTPLKGSDYQDVHRDALPLFPEAGIETPSYQLAVNFPLVDVRSENGPFEVVPGTHRMSRDEGLRLLNEGKLKLEPILMDLGDVMIRDVRALHRGTPNLSDTPRPMVVLGYSRSWLYRPEVSIEIPRAEWEKLSPRAKKLLRFNPIVEKLEEAPKVESYQVFAY